MLKKPCMCRWLVTVPSFGVVYHQLTSVHAVISLCTKYRATIYFTDPKGSRIYTETTPIWGKFYGGVGLDIEIDWDITPINSQRKDNICKRCKPCILTIYTNLSSPRNGSNTKKSCQERHLTGIWYNWRQNEQKVHNLLCFPPAFRSPANSCTEQNSSKTAATWAETLEPWVRTRDIYWRGLFWCSPIAQTDCRNTPPTFYVLNGNSESDSLRVLNYIIRPSQTSLYE